MLLGLVSCGGDPGGGPATPTQPFVPVATSMTLSSPSVTLASLGETTSLTATVKNQNGATMSNASVTWSTSDATVATVSSAGLVTSVENGSATITAKSGSVSATSAVTVAQVASTLEMTPTSHRFTVLGDTISMAVAIRDSGGSEISNPSITWASSDTAVVRVTDAGLVTAINDGIDTITATSGSTSSSSVITVEEGGIVIDPIGVTWTEGATGTITGSGFSGTISENTVTVDGLEASVTAATETDLQITVPEAVCKPTRLADVVVTVASKTRTATVGIRPAAESFSLAVGSGVVTSGNGSCIRLGAATESRKYIVGVFSSSESMSALTPFTQTAVAGVTLSGADNAGPMISSSEVQYFEAPFTAPLSLFSKPHTPSLRLSVNPERQEERLAFAQAELQRREVERRLIDQGALGRVTSQQMTRARLGADVSPSAIGDTIAINFPDHWSASQCTVFDTINAVVRYVGDRALYLEDPANPLDPSFTAEEYAAWDQTFSSTTLPTLFAYYGDQSTNDGFGLDADNRIGVFLTKEVNVGGKAQGYVAAIDFYPKASCPGSNNGEIFYARVPDPDGLHGDAVTKESIAGRMPSLLAHEVAHIVQFTQSLHRGAASKTVWEMEGGATLAEWIVGNSVLGHTGDNLGTTEFLDGWSWYQDLYTDMSHYFGYSSSGAGAPEECTWLGRNPQGPCTGGARAPYGYPATLFRFILDHYGPGYAGGEEGLMRALTNAAQFGYNNLVTTTGASGISEIQTLFGLNLYSDGRDGVHQNSTTSAFTSFDFNPIMSLVSDDQVDRKLQPYLSSDAEPTISKSVRGGSTAYLEWEPPGSHEPTGIAIRTPDGEALPATMNFWIFRVQ